MKCNGAASKNIQCLDEGRQGSQMKVNQTGPEGRKPNEGRQRKREMNMGDNSSRASQRPDCSANGSAFVKYDYR